MPEGPETYRAAQKLAKAAQGGVIDSIYFSFPNLQKQAQMLKGRRVRKIEARAKAVLTQIEGGTTIYSHNQLYGRWQVGRADKRPNTNRSLRLEICTGKKAIRLYSASEIEILKDAEVEAHPYISSLGPDPLAKGVGAKTIEKRIIQKDVARRRLGGLLLSQQFIAGVGNYLRSEILFVSGLRPQLRPCDLEDEERSAFSAATVDLMRQSLKHNGVTFDLARAKALKAEGEPRWLYRHWVFGMDGQPCRDCETEIQRTENAGRRIYWCPNCQGDVP